LSLGGPLFAHLLADLVHDFLFVFPVRIVLVLLEIAVLVPVAVDDVFAGLLLVVEVVAHKALFLRVVWVFRIGAKFFSIDIDIDIKLFVVDVVAKLVFAAHDFALSLPIQFRVVVGLS